MAVDNKARKDGKVTVEDIRDIYSLAIDLGADIGKNVFDCPEFYETECASVTQTFDFLYSGYYFDQYRTGEASPVCVGAGTSPALSSKIDSVKECTDPDMEIPEDIAFVVKCPFRGYSCAVLGIQESGTEAAPAYEISNAESNCSCPLVLPTVGQELDVEAITVFDPNIILAKLVEYSIVPDMRNVVSVTEDLVTFSGPGDTEIQREVVTSITVEYGGYLRPYIKKKWYQRIVEGVMKYGGYLDETGYHHTAYKKELVSRDWFDGPKGYNCLHRFFSYVDDEYATNYPWTGDMTGPMFLCSTGGGMEQNTTCTACLEADPEVTPEEESMEFLQIKGGTCIESTEKANSCIDGCTKRVGPDEWGSYDWVPVDGVLNGYAGENCDKSLDNCTLGAWAVHANWYIQMERIIKELKKYKLPPCPDLQVLSAVGVAAWRGGRQFSATTIRYAAQAQTVVNRTINRLESCEWQHLAEAANAKPTYVANAYAYELTEADLYKLEIEQGDEMTVTVPIDCRNTDSRGTTVKDPQNVFVGCRAKVWCHVVGCNVHPVVHIKNINFGGVLAGRTCRYSVDVKTPSGVIPCVSHTGPSPYEAPASLVFDTITPDDKDRAYVSIDVNFTSCALDSVIYPPAGVSIPEAVTFTIQFVQNK